MSVSLTLSIAGPEAAKLKNRIYEEATQEGLSISEWMIRAAAEYLRKEKESK